jgi:sulfite reductase (NADPH) flavoprotein alpha-component
LTASRALIALQPPLCGLCVGDTGYDKFCQSGRDLDRMLDERDATRLLDRVDIDFENALAEWRDALVAILQMPWRSEALRESAAGPEYGHREGGK